MVREGVRDTCGRLMLFAVDTLMVPGCADSKVYTWSQCLVFTWLT